ncbi:MAG: EamA family transporter RarD [Rhodobacteraceae bacterium]|nr:EamA family transporter RarD [Paracoccaceae bacterium]
MAAPPPPPPPPGDTLRGFLFALAAYLMWGILPLYMKALADVPPAEVVAHRILWSVPVALAILAATGRTADLRAAMRTPSMLGMAAVTAGLVAVNWGIYVHAIGSGQALEAALGYYINPLFSILLGVLLLGERLRPLQVAAVALAGLAVGLLTWEAGRLPVVALGLTVTWGFYAYFKRRLPIGPNQGFTLEVLILLPLAAGYIVWLWAQDAGHFAQSPRTAALLAGTGLVTAIPLMTYANGAKGLRLSTIGIMQYIAPTLILLTAVFLFNEPFGPARAVAFPMIWGALALYSLSLVRGGRRQAQAPGS